MKPGTKVIKRGLFLAILIVTIFLSSTTEFEKSSFDDSESSTVVEEFRATKFCEVTPYSKSKLYGVPNVQKSITRWKVKRLYSGQE